MIVFMSALWDESRSIYKLFQGVKRISYANGSLVKASYHARPILWVLTGIGKANAQRAFDQLVQDYLVETVVLLGYGGGLAPELRIGDLVIGRRLRCERVGSPIYEADIDLLCTAMDLQSKLDEHLTEGDCLTVNQIYSSPHEKEQLYQDTSSHVVDMENYWIAEKANQHGIRFLAVRSISDSFNDRLPEFDHFLDEKGEFKAGQGLWHFATHLDQLNAIPRLYQNAQLARKSLANFFQAFYPMLIEERSYATGIH
jgi:adenosylhomocysteine nucleosidase